MKDLLQRERPGAHRRRPRSTTWIGGRAV